MASIKTISKILIIIPAYNEAGCIEKVVDNLERNYPQYDYVVINDGSTDDTRKICARRGYNFMDLPVNTGLSGAIKSGMRYANYYGYDYVLQLDGDGQHDPLYLRELVKPVESGDADMTIGSRFIQKTGFQSSGLRRLGIKFINFVIKLCCGKKIHDSTSGFRACNAALIHYFADHYAQDYPEPDAIVSAFLNGWIIQEVPVNMHERNEGVSSISSMKSIYYMIKVPLSLLLHKASIGRKR